MVAYATADEYNLEELLQGLEKLRLYGRSHDHIKVKAGQPYFYGMRRSDFAPHLAKDVVASAHQPQHKSTEKEKTPLYPNQLNFIPGELTSLTTAFGYVSYQILPRDVASWFGIIWIHLLQLN